MQNSFAMHPKLEDLVSKDIFNYTLIVVGSARREGESITKAFIAGVIYVQSKTKLSRAKIERALSYSLIEVHKDLYENPYDSVIEAVLTPWYLKKWWLIQDLLPRYKYSNKRALIILIAWSCVIYIFRVNAAYTIWFENRIFLNAGTKDVYERIISKAPYLAGHTGISYFGFFPASIVNYLYFGYVVIIITALIWKGNDK